MADRSLARRHLFYYLEVFNEESGDLIGNLVDITTRGIKLVSKDPIPNNTTFKLRMVLPQGYFRVDELHFEAKSVWSANDVNPDFFDTGFEVLNLSREERKIIRKLIEHIGFNE